MPPREKKISCILIISDKTFLFSIAPTPAPLLYDSPPDNNRADSPPKTTRPPHNQLCSSTYTVILNAFRWVKQQNLFIVCKYASTMSLDIREEQTGLTNLNLETTGRTLATSLFELATLAADIGLLVLVRAHTKVLDSLTSVLGTAKDDGVGTSGGTESKLIEGKNLTTSLQDASSSTLGETESSNRELGDFQKTGVISNGTNDNNSLSLLLLGVANNAGERNRGAVDARHEKALKDSLVEVGVSTTSQEAVKLK
jgi:hypothetical protein